MTQQTKVPVTKPCNLSPIPGIYKVRRSTRCPVTLTHVSRLHTPTHMYIYINEHTYAHIRGLGK